DRGLSSPPSQLVRHRLGLVHQVHDVPAAGRQCVGDQQAVAAPGHRLPAHDHDRSEEHTSELQSRFDLVCRLLLEKKNKSKKQDKLISRKWRSKRSTSSGNNTRYAESRTVGTSQR